MPRIDDCPYTQLNSHDACPYCSSSFRNTTLPMISDEEGYNRQVCPLVTTRIDYDESPFVMSATDYNTLANNNVTPRRGYAQTPPQQLSANEYNEIQSGAAMALQQSNGERTLRFPITTGYQSTFSQYTPTSTPTSTVTMMEIIENPYGGFRVTYNGYTVLLSRPEDPNRLEICRQPYSVITEEILPLILNYLVSQLWNNTVR